MTAEEAKRISFIVSKPSIAARDLYLACVKNAARRGEYIFWENTFETKLDGLKMIKDLGYRVFIRNSKHNVTGYPLYCIFWGENENEVIAGFNGNTYYEL